MQKYEVGKPFPHQEYLSKGEITSAMLNEAFFDVVCVIRNSTREERQQWKKGSLTVAVFEQLDVPFFIFDFGDWSFDVNINILKIKYEEDVNSWLNSEANTITLFLVDADTGILEAIRYISIPRNFAEKTRDILENQTERTKEEININITQTLATVPTKLMLKAAELKYNVK